MLEAEGENWPCEMTEDWYDSTTEEGAGQDTLLTKGERTAEDKAEDLIVFNEGKVRRFQAPQPETLDIGQSNSGGVWAIGRRLATLQERTVAMDKGAKRKDDSTSFSALAPETMAVGSRYPRESLEEEGG